MKEELTYKMRNKADRGVYIHTIGCQMNVYDSGRMISLLRPFGYHEHIQEESADVIIVNTCAIREKAVQKMASFIGRFSAVKKRQQGKILVIAGCVAQQEGEKLLKRFPYIDIVLGTSSIQELPSLLRRVEEGEGPFLETGLAQEPEKAGDPVVYTSPVSDFVTIMRGCDNFCTYCVVPYVRGRETSRPPGEILAEIRARAAAGMKEVTLLGQNVNSYGKKEGLPSFAELLEDVNAVEGLSRIRFVTSHPKDLSAALIGAFNRLGKLCRHIHLPVQSGSDRILKKMNRGYTAREYKDKVRALREVAPDMAITTDIITGFPGERREDFEKTLRLVEDIGYDSLFAFSYSDRPNAPARKFSAKVSEKEKTERLHKVFSLQEEITRKKMENLVGRRLAVLVEGASKNQLRRENTAEDRETELTGRTAGNRVVNFSMGQHQGLDIDRLKGQIITVTIEKAFSNSLRGIPSATESAFPQSKGGSANVA
jgi:tRNA-2-methylthio-N6-dimethylallyladenosine synthase